MNKSGDYPIMSQSEIERAPWNQSDNPEREIEVTISISLSKTVKIKVSDYEIIDSGKDEDGNYFEDIDYSNCNLKDAVKEQIILPQDACNYVDPCLFNRYDVLDDLSDWNVDDFEVLLD